MHRERAERRDREGNERVRFCATMYKGEIFTASSHLFAKEEATKRYPEAAEKDEFVDGYITTRGRFVERNEGEAMLRDEREEKEAAQESWADIDADNLFREDRAERGTE